jgi:DNA end-binding protein Ku
VWHAVQTVWKGSLSFGLVNVPVRLVTTTRRARVSFRQLHAKDHAPIRNERHCTADGEKLSKADIVRGVEIGGNRFVEVTDEEIASVAPESTRALTVNEFVDAGDVDVRYHDRSYALAPDTGGERAYVLLHDTLARRDQVAIGRVTIRNREHVIAVRAGDRVLFADVLHYPEEVRDLGEVESRVPTNVEVTPEEKELTDLLLDRMHKPWDPGKYEDRYEQAIRRLVDAKARGETIEAPAPREAPSPPDLLHALRETLAREEEAEA